MYVIEQRLRKGSRLSQKNRQSGLLEFNAQTWLEQSARFIALGRGAIYLVP